jgi:hypothetical protein
MPAYRNTITCDPQTKQQWSDLLAYLYHYWIMGNHPVTHYPAMYCRGALRLDGLVKHSRIA